MISFKGRYLFYIQLLLFLLLYLFLFTNNSSIDGWGFAAYIKQGEQLFLPHHLLYNFIGFIWVKAVGLMGDFDVLTLLKAMNSVFAILSLVVLGFILRLFKLEWNRVNSWVLFVASSWGFMRYATENEAYILPIFFALIGSLFYVKYYQNSKPINLFYSGTFSAIACLFHQVMFFWWLAMLTGVLYKGRVKSILWFVLPALLVPISYMLVLFYYYKTPLSLNTLSQFVFRDFYSGDANINTSFNGLLLTAISLFRNFIQVHGYVFRLHPIYLIAGLMLIILASLGGIKLIRVKWNWLMLKVMVVWVHALAILLQLLFAFFAHGNAEFMVMIPFLLAITFAQIIKNDLKYLSFIATGMLIWNISVGLIPLHFFDLDNSRFISTRIVDGQKNTLNELYILFNKPRVENEVKYYTGYYPQNIVSGTTNGERSTIDLIKKAIADGGKVCTDLINRPRTLSRENWFITPYCDSLFTGYNQVKTDSTTTLSGKYYLYRIEM